MAQTGPHIPPPTLYPGEHVILKHGNRASTPDPTVTITTLDQLLAIWEANRLHRLGLKPQRIGDQLRGLFGGG